MSVEEKVAVRILMHMIKFATQEILKIDEEFRNKIKETEAIILWKIGDDISFYTTVKGGVIGFDEGEPASDPDLAIEITDAGAALELLFTDIDIGALGKKAKISGEASIAPKLMFIMDTVQKYIGGLRDIIGG
ncbi:MAG: hypothetical protein ACTSQJ_20115 [Promethearchaeota archaeon]